MSSSASPLRAASDRDLDFYERRGVESNEQFTIEIGSRMRVPKRITLTGAEDDIFAYTSSSTLTRGASFGSGDDPVLRSMMNVPERILVAGQERHVGAKAPPRELVLEQSVMPPVREAVRVQTPPRVLTLEDYKFPSADDPPTGNPPPEKPVHGSPAGPEGESGNNPDPWNVDGSSQTTAEAEARFATQVSQHVSAPSSIPTGNAQVMRYLNRLNLRVRRLEEEAHQRYQRDILLGILFAAYAVIKTLNWIRH